MEIALRLKFTQHPDLKAMLLGTGDAELVEACLVIGPIFFGFVELQTGLPKGLFLGKGRRFYWP